MEETLEQSLNNQEHPYVYLKHINKIYPNGVHAVHDFDLDIQKHEFVVFVGPSGCGKSTTLRMIAGLEEITDGELYIDGVFSNESTPKDRDIAMVFQSYALYPHMTVYDNMAFGLKIRHTPKDEMDIRVKEAAKILQLEDYLDRKPKELSGGQRQRVALGRAIVRNAKVFLMDEPLSNLDAKLRVQMRSEIVRIHEEINATTIYVTHDQTEAMTMATRIVVMKDGFIQQIGTPIEIYNNPANLFVAGFIGAPSMNFIETRLADNELVLSEKIKIHLSKDEINKIKEFYNRKIEATEQELLEVKTIVLPSEKGKKAKKKLEDHKKEILEIENKLQGFKDAGQKMDRLIYGIRPEDIIEFDEKQPKISSKIPFKVIVSELLGNEYYIHTDLNDKDFVAKIPANKLIKNGDVLECCLKLDKGHIFDSVSGDRII